MRNRIYRYQKFQLVTAARELKRDGERIQLPRRAFDCILYLIEHRDRAVGRDELTAAVWGRVDVTDAQLSQVMLQARRAIDDSGQAQHTIRTLPGFGYHWIADTEDRLDRDDDGESSLVARTRAAAPSLPDGVSGVDQEVIDEAEASNDAFIQTAPPMVAQPPAMPSSVRQHRRLAVVAIAVLLAIALAATTLLRQRVPASSAAPEAGISASALAVLPLEVTGPSDSGWVRLGAMDLIAERLRSAGLTVPPSESVLVALRGGAEPRGDKRPHKLGRVLGVGILIEGKAIQSPDGWMVELAASRGETQRYTATAKHADVIRAARQAADLLLAAIGRTPPPEHAESGDIDERLQQVQAAMLAGELETANAILAAIPEQDAPRVKLAQARISSRFGRYDQAEAAYTELISDPAVRSDPPLLGRSLSFRAAAYGHRRNFAAAERDYDAAANILRSANSPIDLARALNGRGLSRIGLERFDEAAADFGRARIEAQRSGDQLGMIQSDANFGQLEISRARPEQALRYLRSAAEGFEAFGAVERTLAALTGAFVAETALLHWPEALAVTERQWALRDRAGDPGLRLQIAVNRGIALAAMGHLRETQALLDEAERAHRDTRSQKRRYLQALRAEITWRRGQPGEAVSAADQALSSWPVEDEDPNSESRTRLVLLRQRASIATGDAATTLERDLDPSPATGEPSPILLVARAERAASRNQPADAERNFRAAMTKVEARGVPADLATVAEAYGRWLLTQGRIDEAGALAGRVAPWANRDFDCALFQAVVLKARGDHAATAAALQQVHALAGEREIPAELQTVASR